MTTDPIDDAALDAALREVPPVLPDAGFTAAVMRRIATEEAAQRSALGPVQALDGLRAIERCDRHHRRWTMVGLGAGSLVALALGVAGAEGAPAMTLETSLGLAVAFCVTAWQLLESLDPPAATRHGA